MYSVKDSWLFIMRVSPFGNLRVKAYFQLTAAYRRLSRPSSAFSAKAFTSRSFSLEQLSYSPLFVFEIIQHFCLSFANNCFWVVISLVWKDFLEITLFCLSPLDYYQASTKLFPLLYGKTIIIFITSFSQYTTICFVSFFFIRFSMNNFETLFEFLVGPSGLEPPTSCLSGTRSNLLSYEPMWLVSDFCVTWVGGDDGIRTHDPLLAGQVLSQLSYTPIFREEVRVKSE